MWLLPGSAHCQINQKTVTVIVTKSQRFALHFGGITHKTCFSVMLKHLAPKDDSNRCGSAKLRKWNDQHICRPVT